MLKNLKLALLLMCSDISTKRMAWKEINNMIDERKRDYILKYQA